MLETLIIEYGSTIDGGLKFLANNNTLELGAPTGTFNVAGFDAIVSDSYTDWTLTGNSASLAIDGSGTITNTGSLAGAVVARLEAGGAFTNAAGAVIDGTVYGVATQHNVTNLGTIIGYSNGVGLGVGGTFVNGSNSDTTAFVSGYYGVLVDRATGTVDNYGTIVGRSTGGVELELGGGVTNGSSSDSTANITGKRFGVGFSASTGSVTNFGSISATGTSGVGISLRAEIGNVSNNAGAVISGAYGVVAIGYASVTNAGSIIGTEGGVSVMGPGVITNGSTGDTAAIISGGRYGVEVGAGSTIANFGKISASAGPAILAGTGAVTVINAGTLSGMDSSSAGVRLDVGGSVSNQAAAVISGVAYGVKILTDSGTVTNSGSITATGSHAAAVFLAAGGSVTNAAGAAVTGVQGVVSAGTATLLNDGTITGGAFICDTGIVTNGASGLTSALITGSGFGVEVGAGSAIINYGKISASAGPAILTTGSYAAGVTVVNAGTISGTGGTAVDLAGGVSRVVFDPGAVFKGNVVAQGPGNTLELAAGTKAGNISGLGSNFTGFDTIVVDPSATWAISGHDTLGPNAFITTGPGATLNVTGSVQAGSGLVLSSSGTMTVGAAGTLEVGSAGGAKGGSITVDAGATLTAAGTIRAAVVDQGSLIFDDGNTTTISGSLTGSGSAAIDPGAVLDVSGQLGLAGISFVGGSGGATLELGTANGVSSTISGFGAEKSIDLLHAVGTSDTFLDNVLTVNAAKGVVATLDFAPGLSAGNFALASDQHGGTMISFVPN